MIDNHRIDDPRPEDHERDRFAPSASGSPVLRRLAGGLLGLALALGTVVAGTTAVLRAQETTAAQAIPDASELGQVAVLTPTEDQQRISRRVVYELQTGHLEGLTIDDALSSKLLDEYLEFLDPNRRYFTQDDVASFEKYREVLDDAITKGELDPGFEIFAVWRERRAERYGYMKELLENELDNVSFDVEEWLETDRRESPWPEDRAAAEDIWRRWFKNDVLTLKSSGRSQEEILDILGRRYDDQLVSIRQSNGDDAFRVFMNRFAGLYDPHTEYFPPRKAENFDIEMSLSLEGIGALLEPNGEYTRVVRLIPGGPAEGGGELKASDRIVGVAQGDDGEMTNVIGWRLDDVVDLIRGPKESVVRLEVLPSDQPTGGVTREIRIVRDEVKLEEQAARSTILDIERDGESYRVGLIHLPAFYIDFAAARARDPDFKSSSRDVAKLLVEMRQQEVDGVVIDLRNNGGGSLYEAKQLTGLFLPAGPVVQVRDHDGNVDRQYAGGRRALWEGPLVVMVNRLSASASEIFAGAIQDYGRGLIVGTPTFGKGTVQNLTPLEDGQLKLTQATFYRVSGASTQERGVVPDIPFPSEYDLTEIGESALDNPLPWDMIAPAPGFRKDTTLAQLVPALGGKHLERSSQDPEFQYYADLIEYRNDVREITRISLHEETRQREREEDEARRLAIENRRRVGLGKEPVASFEELEAERDAERLSRADSRDDAEAGEEGPGASSAGDADSTGDSVAAEGSGAADEADEPETSDGTKLVPDAYAKEAAKILVDAIEQPVRKTVRR